MKLINEKRSFKFYSSNVCKCLEIDNTPQIFKNLLYNSMAWDCPEIGVTWMWSPIDGNLSRLYLRATSPLVPETVRSKVLII